MDNRHVMLAGLAVLALLGLVSVVRSTRKQAYEAARALHTGAAAVNLAGRSLLTGALIVGAQWLVISHVDQRSAAYWLALAVPAALAGYTLTRAFTITTLTHRGGGWR